MNSSRSSIKLLAARTVQVIELFDRGRFGFLQTLQRGPLEQEGRGQRPPQIFAAQFQGLGKVLFEQCLQAIGECRALVDHRAAMADQLLQQPRLAVVGLPGLELVVVRQEQLRQISRVLAVVLGPAGHKGFAELLQRDRIDGVERDPGIRLQEENETGRRLLQADGHAGGGMFLAQLEEPVVQRLGRGADGLRAPVVPVRVSMRWRSAL